MQFLPILQFAFISALCITTVPSSQIEYFETYARGEIIDGKLKPILFALSKSLILSSFEFIWPTVIQVFLQV